MATLDLSVFNGGTGNGYIAEEHSSQVVMATNQFSAIESLARIENMNTSTKLVPRWYGDSPAVVAEGATIAESTQFNDSVVLTARKWASILHINEEDLNDTFIDVLNRFKTSWATNWARRFDNACLGVAATENGTTVPYTSVYQKLATGGGTITPTAGAVTFAQLNGIVAAVEAKPMFDPSKMAFIAHPSFAQVLRGLVDNNNRPILQDPLGGTTPTLFGYPVKYSFGAQKTTVATAGGGIDAGADGNKLLIFGNTDMLINGKRSTVESQISRDAKFDTDGVLLKIRARRAFKVADADAFAILEKTAS
jgi:HK97 family phage major capsid protein